jgi:heat-inducible transcriptional repressor
VLNLTKKIRFPETQIEVILYKKILDIIFKLKFICSMTEPTSLSSRHQNILKATIQKYIATAEPVGSQTLARECDFKISSATIRNVMGHLEDAGLLYQPHTSAGRIPSDSGYRIYVDRLLDFDRPIGKEVEKFLGDRLCSRHWSFEAILQKTTKILAELSGYIALITFPQHPSDTLRHLQLVRVASGQILLVVVTDSYQTQSILTDLTFDNQDEEVLERELQILSNFLNQKLKGQSLTEIATLDCTEIDRDFSRYADLLSIITQELIRFLKPVANSTQIAIHGVAEVLRQPEFSQLQQVQTLLYLLEEEQEQLLPVICSFPNNNSYRGVTIKIGAENYLKPMRTCTLVAANYYQDNIPVGSVGVIGPTRMLYENTISLVESTADYLSEAFNVSKVRLA